MTEPLPCGSEARSRAARVLGDVLDELGLERTSSARPTAVRSGAVVDAAGGFVLRHCSESSWTSVGRPSLSTQDRRSGVVALGAAVRADDGAHRIGVERRQWERLERLDGTKRERFLPVTSASTGTFEKLLREPLSSASTAASAMSASSTTQQRRLGGLLARPTAPGVSRESRGRRRQHGGSVASGDAPISAASRVRPLPRGPVAVSSAPCSARARRHCSRAALRARRARRTPSPVHVEFEGSGRGCR